MMMDDDVPFRHWHDDLIYTWATIRFFRSEDSIRQWQVEQGNFQGEILSLAEVWELSQRWYHQRLSPVYRGCTVAQVEEIFRSLNLTSEFWRMPEPLE